MSFFKSLVNKGVDLIKAKPVTGGSAGGPRDGRGIGPQDGRGGKCPGRKSEGELTDEEKKKKAREKKLPSLKKSFVNLVPPKPATTPVKKAQQGNLMKAHINKMRKGLYSMRSNITEWAQQFYSTPFHVDALQCLKDNIACDKKRGKVDKDGKNYRELQEMPKSKRESHQETQQKKMEPITKEETRILLRMRELEEDLITHEISQAKARATMSKALDVEQLQPSGVTGAVEAKPVTMPDGEEDRRIVEAMADPRWLEEQGLPYGLRSGAPNKEDMSKAEGSAEIQGPNPNEDLYRSRGQLSSFSVDVGMLNPNDEGNGGFNQPEPGEKVDEPQYIVTRLIPNGGGTFGSSRGG